MNPITITIDGPAGSGKGTTARLLAEKLGFRDIDTGSMYRAIGVYLDEKGVDLENIEDGDLDNVSLEIGVDDSIFINGEDYTSKIRTPLAGQNASKVATKRIVRNCVDDTIRAMLMKGNYILEGRDMGRIFSDFAKVKIFLIADPEVRAHRRWLELQKKGDTTSESDILAQILERDHRDMTREISPLLKSPDAIEVDTTHLTIPEQVEKIYEICRSRISVS